MNAENRHGFPLDVRLDQIYVFYINNVWHGHLSVHLLCNMNDAGSRVELITVTTPSQRCRGDAADRAGASAALNAVSAR